MRLGDPLQKVVPDRHPENGDHQTLEHRHKDADPQQRNHGSGVEMPQNNKRDGEGSERVRYEEGTVDEGVRGGREGQEGGRKEGQLGDRGDAEGDGDAGQDQEGVGCQYCRKGGEGEPGQEGGHCQEFHYQ